MAKVNEDLPVFAGMTPEQKQELIRKAQKAGFDFSRPVVPGFAQKVIAASEPNNQNPSIVLDENTTEEELNAFLKGF